MVGYMHKFIITILQMDYVQSQQQPYLLVMYGSFFCSLAGAGVVCPYNLLVRHSPLSAWTYVECSRHLMMCYISRHISCPSISPAAAAVAGNIRETDTTSVRGFAREIAVPFASPQFFRQIDPTLF